MKKLFKCFGALCCAAAVFTAMLPISAVASAVVENDTKSFEIGDVDMNGVVNSSDALMIIRSSAGMVKLTEEQSKLADVNGDGRVNSSDALNTLQISIKSTVHAIASKLQSTVPVADFEEEVVRLCNEKRAEFGIAPLKISDDLSKAAEIRVKELKDRCEHIRPNGDSWSTVVNEIGYNFLTAGENIAGGIKTPQDVVAEWMNSSGHRANILNPDFSQIGVAYTFIENSQYGSYWDQLFAGVSEQLYDESNSINTLLNKINAAREEKGLSALSMDESLTKLAAVRADDITVKMDNTRPDGSSWKTLLDKFNIDYTALSQVFCAGPQSSQDVLTYYTKDPSSVPKFLDPEKDYHKIGIGHAFVDGDEYGHYWVIILTD